MFNTISFSKTAKKLDGQQYYKIKMKTYLNTEINNLERALTDAKALRDMMWNDKLATPSEYSSNVSKKNGKPLGYRNYVNYKLRNYKQQEC